MAKLKGRKRNLKTVRQAAQDRQKSQKKPNWLKKLFKLAWAPFGALFKWLNQPLSIHADKPQKGLMANLTKSRSMVPAYVRNSFTELKMVIWPSFPTALRLTFAVCIFAAIFALLVLVFDWALTHIFEELILHEGENIRNLF